MLLCKDCNHLDVCKFTDAGDGRCQKPEHFSDKRKTAEIMRISPQTMKALNYMGRCVHAADQGG